MPDLILGGIRWITFLTICSNFRPASISGGLTANTTAELVRFLRAENLPGHFPFTAGVFPMKRDDEDPTRMFAGEGGPAKTNARRSKRQLPQTAFFKLQPPAASLGAGPTTPQSSTACRLQLERPDGSRMTLTLPSFDAAALNALVADFLRGSSR